MRVFLVMTVGVVGLVLGAGCGGSTGSEESDLPLETEAVLVVTAQGPVDLASITLSEKDLAQVRKLPMEEQAAAMAQKICPVQLDEDGQPNRLGSMGMPIKVIVEGREVYVCCAGCIAELKAEPAKFLVKLGPEVTETTDEE